MPADALDCTLAHALVCVLGACSSIIMTALVDRSDITSTRDQAPWENIQLLWRHSEKSKIQVPLGLTFLLQNAMNFEAFIAQKSFQTIY